MRRYNRNMRTICRLFKLKVILREWKNRKCFVMTCEKKKEKTKPIKFCVKYSDYCKC